MIIISDYIEDMKITQELLKKSASCRSLYLFGRSSICQNSLKLVGLPKKGITLIIIFSIVKVKLLFKFFFYFSPNYTKDFIYYWKVYFQTKP